ncbi:MAG: carbohydrate-binding domain-containing protein [Ruminococcaceae bacterium]|nr:carbohydrate-binding domain-containing protein [Oscillospiraceae bacterium]
MAERMEIMKRFGFVSLLLAALVLFTSCGIMGDLKDDGVFDIVLDDSRITVDGKKITEDTETPVFAAHDIIYYEEGKDFTYGEGGEKDGHSKAEADSHTVVHIGKAGVYRLSGTLSKGQIFVDLGEGAEVDPEAVVTLIFDGASVTCDVAPAVLFYNVYECGSSDAETATKDVDTSAAGANVIIADGSSNYIDGSYVEKIYDPDTVVLSEDGTEVADAEKLHKYDGAFYSRMSMNVFGGEVGDGILNITAENEGLDSELHLTLNGGIVNIVSGNDGINTNEDGVSVTTINGGSLEIAVTGETGEGDGIDSNGWLVINGGEVTAFACSKSADAGIDSDMGIHITGGTVTAGGSMLDRIEEGGQNFAVFSFYEARKAGELISIKDESEKTVAEISPLNDCSNIIYSSPDLTAGTYTLWVEDELFGGCKGGMMGQGGFKPDGVQGETLPEAPEGEGTVRPDFERPENGEAPEGGGRRPFGEEPPEGFENMTPPEESEDRTPPEGFEGKEFPEGSENMTPPEGFENMTPPEGFDGNMMQGRPDGNFDSTAMFDKDFVITDGGNYFTDVQIWTVYE